LKAKTKKRKEKKKLNQDQEIVFSDGLEHSDEEMELFFESRRTVKELIQPLGVNPTPLDYMVVEDNGVSLYTMCLYIHKLPRSSTFAVTYAELYNTPGITSNTYINPMGNEKSTKQLDKRIQMLGVEDYAAREQRDRNRVRKIDAKIHDAEQYAQDVESGDNQLFEVAFLFTVQSQSLDGLRMKVNDLHMKAREKGIELHACYALHPEAFVSGYPVNKVQEATTGAGLLKASPVKWHVLDRGALCDIFNHTKSTFSHKNGVFLGRNLRTGQPVLYDNYDKSHEAFGICVSGKTGTGKSAMIKMYESRQIDFGHKFRSIDFEARGPRGEYAIMADAVNGTNIQIKADSDKIMNIFEVDAEYEFDEISGKEYMVLHLSDKEVDMQNLLMTLILAGEQKDTFSNLVFIKRIVTDTITALFEERGIHDGDPESLYTTANILKNGRLQAGRVKKALPTITDFYKLVLLHRKDNNDRSYDMPYSIVLAAMKDYVRELYYCPEDLEFFTKEQFESFAINPRMNRRECPMCNGFVEEIHGIRPYYDGQSTVHFDKNSPHINVDISQVPLADRSVAMLVALNLMQENVVKKNSLNPLKAEPIDLLVDEAHLAFDSEPARKFLEVFYRTARKRNVSPITATQALADYDKYSETQGIVKNATTIILFRQDIQDRSFMKRVTSLTDSQIDAVVSLGGDYDEETGSTRKGEMCLIDNGSKVVFLRSDYLVDSEALVVETDIQKIKEMYKGLTTVS
jgi:hypothetical protein